MEQSPTLFHLIDSFFLCDRECGYLLYLSSPCLFFLLLFFMFFLCKTVNMHISVSVILCLYSLLKHIIKINKKKKKTVNFLILVWLKLVTLARRRTYNNTVNLKLRAPDKAANHGRF